MVTTLAPSVGGIAAEDVGLDYRAHFEKIYKDAAGDADRIPWSDGVANPALVAWLNHVAPTLIRCGSRVAVVGCGLGEDARELVARGFDVTAFDVCPTAIEWAKRLDPGNAHMYHVADLLNLPAGWKHRFDLVVEIYTVQSLPPGARVAVMTCVRELAGPHGYVLIICRGAKGPTPAADGPPWALTVDELVEASRHAGLAPVGSIDQFLDDQDPPQLRIRGAFRRG